ncbi:MAG: RagB/SusD family nutrient uptake outer membrane protein [Breznakibacter sp.]
MKKNLNNIVLAVVLASSLVACDDFLDTTPTDSVSDKLVWSSKETAQLTVNYMYVDVWNISQNECAAGMTEALTDVFKYGDMTYNALCYIPSEIAYGGANLTNSYVDVYLGMWGTMYRYIATANNTLASMKKYATFSEKDQKEIEAEIRFFRACYYFTLAKRYKEVIIYDENMENYAKDREISSESDVWDFIYNDLKFAAENLSVSTKPNSRVTSGAAYAMLSRAMLYAERWSEVKTAAEKVLEMGYSMSSDLNAPFTDGGEGAIFQYCFDENGKYHSFDNYYAPGGDQDFNRTLGGYGTPTQEMVEEFELAKGGKADWSEWHNAEGTNVTPPYDQLEPRFHHTILYNGALWKGRTIETFVGGRDGYAQWKVDTKPAGRSTTGYFLRKGVNESHDFAVTQKSVQPYTLFRYAEVLLNYAEACYNLNALEAAKNALNQVRTRPAVGLPEVTVSGDKLMEAIRHERKVELAYEGLYYWDVRRWKLADKIFSNYLVHGLKIEKNANGSFTYNYVECDTEDRHFPAKMYRFPIPQSELSTNGKVTQYPEWN